MGSVATCPLAFDPACDCPRDGFESLSCDHLLECMNYAVNADRQGKSGPQGLKNRFAQQINGKCGPTTKSWKDHDDQIRGNQDKLADYADYYQNQKKCGDPPADVMEYATKPRPQASDWNPPAGAVCPEEVEKAAAASAAANAAAQAAQAAAQAEAEEAAGAAAEGAAATEEAAGAAELLELLPLLAL